MGRMLGLLLAGLLAGDLLASELQVTLLADGVTISIPFASIDKANVVPNF